jgi:hypothetical protein
LKAVSLVGAGGLVPKLGMPLALRFETAEARGLLDATGAVEVEVVLGRASDSRDVFFCSAGAGGAGRASDDSDGFLRSCSVDAGWRS